MGKTWQDRRIEELTIKTKIYQYYGRRRGPKLSKRKIKILENIFPELELREENIKGYVSDICEKKINISLEIGFGSGENLINLIEKSENNRYFIGCEPYLNGIASLLSNLKLEDYKKIRLYKHDIRELFLNLSKKIFDEIYILYPDPWPKARHKKRRIINDENLNLFLSKLKINGKIFVATDVKSYFDSIYYLFANNINLKIMNFKNFYFRPEKIISTRYEKKALKKKITPFYLEAKKILD